MLLLKCSNVQYGVGREIYLTLKTLGFKAAPACKKIYFFNLYIDCRRLNLQLRFFLTQRIMFDYVDWSFVNDYTSLGWYR